MVAFNFSPKFAEAVASGRKTQTIRQNARVKPGQRIQLYTGQRTKACRKLGEAICTSVTPIMLRPLRVVLDGRALSFLASDEFAIADGFEDYAEMAIWFEKRYRSAFFAGFVIRWTRKESQS